MFTVPVYASAFVALYHAMFASAQGTNVTCLDIYSWMDNSRGQNPCLMTAYLNSACLADPTDAYVYSLPEDYHYSPPTIAIATPCQCSTVFYSMISACATCQDRTSVPWSTWQTNCSTDYARLWPTNIPAGTSIPAWAYLDVVQPDAFNVSAAQAVEAQHPPDSSALPSPTPSPIPSPSSSSSPGLSASASVPGTASGTSGNDTGEPTGLPAPLPSPGKSESSKKSDVGAIVGGVVGGVGGAAVLAGVILFLVLRHRRTSAAGTQLDSAVPSPQAPHAEGPAFDPYAGAHVATPVVQQQQLQQGPTMQLYNPNDPATFPPAASHSAAGVGAGGTSVYSQGVSEPYTPTSFGAEARQPGGYTGVAEV